MRSLIPDALRAVRRFPRVSLVSPIYGVAPYLPRFLDSLDAQDYPHDRLQVVLVLDGACDDSPRICRAWAERTDLDVEIVETDPIPMTGSPPTSSPGCWIPGAGVTSC